jgi:hypothetical protein
MHPASTVPHGRPATGQAGSAACSASPSGVGKVHFGPLHADDVTTALGSGLAVLLILAFAKWFALGRRGSRHHAA